MKALAAFAALCGFLVLLASPAGTVEPNLWRPVPASMHEAVPRAKPDRNAGLPEGVAVVRQCAASTMLARVVDARGTRVYYARHSRTAFDEMVRGGCTRIQKGCNTCSVSYTGCTPQQRAACTDGDCLARVCRRRTICSAKGCTAHADAPPSCEARFVRQACLESAFDTPVSRAEPSDR